MVIATFYEPKEAAKGFTVGDRVRGKFMRQARNIYSDAKKLKLPTVTGTIRLESRDLNPSQGEASDYRPDPQAEQEIVLRLTERSINLLPQEVAHTAIRDTPFLGSA